MKHRTTPSEKRFLCLLRDTFRTPAYAVLGQVPVPADEGGTRDRRVDALVIGTWESRQAAILGFEMKADRASWLQELRDPSKADDVAQFCDGWYILADPDVVLDKEVPTKWGLYVPKHGSLDLIKPAAPLSPKEPTRALLFSIFKAFMVQLQPITEEDLLKKQYDKGYEAGNLEARRFFKQSLEDFQASRVHDDLDGIRRLLSRGPSNLIAERIVLAEKLLGLFTNWNHLRPTKAAIEAVEFASKGGLKQVIDQLSYLRKTAGQLHDSIGESIERARAAHDEACRLGLPGNVDSIEG